MVLKSSYGIPLWRKKTDKELMKDNKHDEAKKHKDDQKDDSGDNQRKKKKM